MSMFGIFDSADTMTHDEHKGMAATHPDRFLFVDEPVLDHAIFCRKPPVDRVAIITCAGGGCGPLGSGYVDEKMADAGVTGDVNAAPSAYALYMAAKRIAGPKGVLFIYNNYMGDYLNNDMATEMLTTEGIQAMQLIVTDNMGSAPGEPKENRNGLCSLAQVIKAANAAARTGASLEEVHRIASKVNDRAVTLSAVLNKEENKVVYGSGFAGEPPIKSEKDTSATGVVNTSFEMILDELKPSKTDKLYVMINVLRMVSYAEAYALASVVDAYLSKKGYAHELSVGHFFCANNEPGYYFTVLAADDEINKYVSERACTDSFVL